MSITDWAIKKAVLGILSDADKDGKVKSLSDTIDGLVKSFFPGSEKEIKQALVRGIMLPVARNLLANDAQFEKEVKIIN